MKTISMYLRSAKTEAEAAGESTEGMASSMSELRQEILALTGQRVDIQIDENSFKSSYVILKELSEVWDDLTDVSRANILEMIAGKRNSNVVAALLENFSIAEEALGEAANSAGSALAENEKYLDSIQGKINILKSKFESFSATFVDSDLVKGVIDLASGLFAALDGLAKMIDVLGGLPTVLTLVATIVSATSSKFATFLGKIETLPSLLDILTMPFNAIGTAGFKIYETFSLAGAAIIDFGNGASTAGEMLKAVIPAAGLIATGISVLIGIMETLHKRSLENAQALKDLGEEAAESNNEINKLAEKYFELVDALEANNASKDKLLQIEDSLLSKLELERYELDGLIKKYGDYQNAIRGAIYEKARENKLNIASSLPSYQQDILDTAMKETLDDFEDMLYDKFGYSRGSSGVINLYDSNYLGNTDLDVADRRSAYAAVQALKNAGFHPTYDSVVDSEGKNALNSFSIQLSVDTNSLDSIKNAYAKLEEMRNAMQEAGAVDNYVYRSIDKSYQAFKTTMDAYNAQLKSYNQAIVQVAFSNQQLSEDAVNTQSEFANFRQSIIDSIENGADNSELSGFTGTVEDIESAVDDFLKSYGGFSKFYDSLGNYVPDSIGNMVSSYSQQVAGFKSAVKEFEETGKISTETYQKYFDGNEELADCIDVVDGKLTINTESLKEHIATLEEETIKSMAAAGATDNQIGRIHGLTTALTELISADDESLEQIKELQSMLNETGDGKLYSTDEVESLLKIYPELEKHIEDVGEGYKIEEQALRDLIDARKDNIKLQAYEIAGVDEARKALTNYLGNSQSTLNMEAIFNKYSDDINSVEDFISKYEESLGYSYLDENTTEVPEALENFINTLILARDTIKSYFSIIDEFGTEDYNPGTSGSDSGRTEDTETEFERRYKLHQHYVAMEQETEEEYLRWLESAWRDAYRNGQIEEGEQYQYEEEVYEKRKELFTDYLSDTEHQIEMMQNREASASEIVPMYEKLMADVEAQKAKYISMGLDENSEYIQELESQWWDYRNSLLDLYSEDLGRKIAGYEHDIFLIENNDINNTRSADIVAVYKKMQDETHALAEEYRRRGISENSEYIRELQNQWWSYQSEITEIRKNEFNRYLDIGRYQIDNMILDNASIDEVTDSWKNLLGAVNEEILYYTSIGYDATSDIIRELEEEARNVSESMIESIQNVVDEANELVDGFENVYSTLTDAAKEYAQNGFLSVDSLQSILSLGPKYLAMLQDENGQLVINEKSLQEVIAARTNEMAAETAYAYAKQILLATEQNEIQTLENLIVVSQSAGNATWDMAYATLALAKAMGEAKGIDASYYETAYDNLRKMQAVTKTSVDTVSAYYKTLDESYISQKDALDKILQLTQDMIKWELEEQKEALEDQKDDYADIIEQKKEMIQLAEEQADREKDLSEKLEKMAKLQGQIAQLSLDDSREAQAQRRKLEEELRELQKELADDQSDYSLEMQEEALDKELEMYQEEKDDEIEALEDTLSSAEKLYQAAIDRIENGWDTLYSDLLNWNYEYGSTLQSELEDAWSAALAAAERYGSFVDALEGVEGFTDLGSAEGSTDRPLDSYNEGAADRTIDSMKEVSLAWWTEPDSERAALNRKQLGLEKQYEALAGEDIYRENGRWYHSDGDELYSMTDDEIASAVVRRMKENAAAWHSASDTNKIRLAEENDILGKRLKNNLGMNVYRDSAGVWWVDGEELFEKYKYHSGGIAGRKPTLQENEVLSLLEKGEVVLDEKKSNALYKVVDFIAELSDRLGTVLDASKIGSIFGGSSRPNTSLAYADMISRESEQLLSKVSGDTTYTIERLEVSAPVNVVQKLGKEELKEHADMIGSLSAQYIQEGFTKRGIKRSASLF